jgi:hypothetical protein
MVALLNPTTIQPYANLELECTLIMHIHVIQIWLPFSHGLHVYGKSIVTMKIFQDGALSRTNVGINCKDLLHV